MLITPNELELSAERRRAHRRFMRMRRLACRLLRERNELATEITKAKAKKESQ